MWITRLAPVLLCSAALLACEGASEPDSAVPEPTPDEVYEAAGVHAANPLLGSWALASAADASGEVDFPTSAHIVTAHKP